MAKRQRSSGRLSGGEAQRVSLACAFAIQPDLLMLDEPFSALDAPTRLRLLDDFRSLLAATSITTIFITHDLDEALLLGARVAVILDGRMRQVGAPQEVFNSPADQEVAAFVGVKTVIPGEVTAVHEGQVTVKAAGIDLQAVGEAAPGWSVLLRLRSEDITLWSHDSHVLPLEHPKFTQGVYLAHHTAGAAGGGRRGLRLYTGRAGHTGFCSGNAIKR